MDAAKQKKLLLLGSWSDMRRSPCECCGRPIVLVEQWRRSPLWMEVHRDGDDYLDSVFILHTADRCRPAED